MKKIALTLALIFTSSAAFASAEVGKPAPDFSAVAASGKSVKLSDYKGKIVVLEWNNPECPFVKKFYKPGKMQSLQADAKKQGVVWLTVNSSAEGKQGHADAKAAKAYIAEVKAAQTEYLLDGKGDIGKLYGAKTTPHMFVVDKDGTLAYAGAIDNKPSPMSSEIEGATNYVTAAIDALKAGKKPDPATTQAYGCNVKY